MIMDIANQQRSELSSRQNDNHTKISTDFIQTTTVKPSALKRSFDVAFLMLPDDKMRQKQIEKQARHDSPEIIYPKDLSPRQLIQNDHINPEFFNNNELRKYPNITIRSPRRVYDDPTILPEMENPKSAFTKVASSRMESPIPQPPLSPGQLSCPSMSPPISTTPPRSLNSNGSANGNNGPILYQHFRPEYQLNGAFHSVGQASQVLAAQNNRLKQQLMYRPMTPNGSPELIHAGYLPPGANGFPFGGPTINPFVPQPELIRNPTAAAVLSALIPPTLASTFSLTAQNVCAKCNISFRMTSDLVYHMRSHHKSEVASDPHRRKRQEKLKCPVCNESFRERHHLTRHMTAHQDKASDQSDIINATKQQTSALINGHHSGHHGQMIAERK